MLGLLPFDMARCLCRGQKNPLHVAVYHSLASRQRAMWLIPLCVVGQDNDLFRPVEHVNPVAIDLNKIMHVAYFAVG